MAKSTCICQCLRPKLAKTTKHLRAAPCGLRPHGAPPHGRCIFESILMGGRKVLVFANTRSPNWPKQKKNGLRATPCALGHMGHRFTDGAFLSPPLWDGEKYLYLPIPKAQTDRSCKNRLRATPCGLRQHGAPLTDGCIFESTLMGGRKVVVFAYARGAS